MRSIRSLRSAASDEDAFTATIERIFAFDPDPDTRKIEIRMLPATKAGCIGSTDEVLRQMRRFEDLGIELVLCRVIPTTENVQRIGEEVSRRHAEVGRDCRSRVDAEIVTTNRVRLKPPSAGPCP